MMKPVRDPMLTHMGLRVGRLEDRVEKVSRTQRLTAAALLAVGVFCALSWAYVFLSGAIA